MAAEEQAGTPSYDHLLNTAAGTVTVAASVLGVFGIGTGVATALLRNAPEATLTTTCVAGAGVLAGVTSAIVKSRATVGVHVVANRIVLGLTTFGVLAMWILVGLSYAEFGARSAGSTLSWWLFLGGLGVGSLGLAIWVWRARSLQVRQGLALGALFVFGSAMLAIVVLAAAVLRTASRPAIAAELTPLDTPAGYVTLTATVRAVGLSADERYQILVHLLRDTEGTDSVMIFQAFVGPDATGNIDYAFKVSFSPDPSRLWVGITVHPARESETPSAVPDNCGVNSDTKAKRRPTCTMLSVPRILAPSDAANPSPSG